MPTKWLATQLRASGFRTLPPGKRPEPYWAQLVLSEPTTQEANLQQGVFRETGDLAPGKLIVHQDTSRMDIVLFAEDRPVQELITLGSLKDALAAFKPVTARWLSSGPDGVARLAFGCLLLRPTRDESGSLEVLNSVLPAAQLGLNVEGLKDFSLQTNIRSVARSNEGLSINRIAKWTAPVTTVTQLEVRRDGQQVSTEREPLTSVQLSLDVNTDPRRGEQIATEALDPLFEQLIEEARDIAGGEV